MMLYLRRKQKNMKPESFVIASRFCGPTPSGNGGYVCGSVAAHLPGTVSVRLKAPPPLQIALQIEVSDGEARLMQGSDVIAEARSADLDLTPPAAPSFEDAKDATKSYAGFAHHPFPRCFVCGPQRGRGDGLRIFAGPMRSRALVAAPWIPDASLADRSGKVRAEFLWAALDCPGAWAAGPYPEGKALVLGELCARVTGTVMPEENCVVIGWPIESDGRKRFAGTAVFASSGQAVAVARATWLEVPASAFGGM